MPFPFFPLFNFPYYFSLFYFYFIIYLSIQSPVENSQYADPFVESSSSELSDIPEVEEELIGSEEANQSTGYTGHSTNQVSSCNNGGNDILKLNSVALFFSKYYMCACTSILF